VYLDAEGTPEQLDVLHDQVLQTSPVGSILNEPVSVATHLNASATT
jgi:hypothetical protein